MPEKDITKSRKKDHIRITLNKDVEPNRNYFDDVALVHCALPEVNFKDISTKTTFLSREISAPLLITGMTGGTPQAGKINKNLARAAEKMNILMGVGSQRAGIEHPSIQHTYQVRDVAPNVFLIANLGIVQFAKGYTVEEAKKAIKMIEADAIALNINPSQEISQPEGDTDWRGCLKMAEKISKGCGKPVIAKEVGTGISYEVAKKLQDAGVSAIDVSGMGGTSWSLIESYRSSENIGEKLKSWGIPTPAAAVEAAETVSVPVIASGGIRDGFDAAKALALGASISGMALPFLKAAAVSAAEVEKKIKQTAKEIKVSMFLTGSSSMNELREKPVVISGYVKEWLESRGFDTKKFARR